MRKPFVVIDAEILNSSIWSESAATRLVWFTLLILCDTEGYVGAAVPGLARQAGVTVAECEAALDTFLSPDPHSRTTAHEGRRIEAVERGWRVLNFEAALDRMSLERKRVRERVRKWRARKKASAGDVSKADGNVTVRSGIRDKGPETRDQVRTNNEPINQARTREDGPRKNPLMTDRAGWEARWHVAVRALAEIQDCDPTVIAREHSLYEGRAKLNPAGMTEDRLMHTVLSLERAIVAEGQRQASKPASEAAERVWREREAQAPTAGQVKRQVESLAAAFAAGGGSFEEFCAARRISAEVADESGLRAACA
jgi:hypothetical protein